MAARTSKYARLHDTLRLSLQSGRYAPGEHIDPNALARQYSMSPTPVLYALNRLVGEGLLVEPVRGGFHVPHVHLTERALHDLYSGMDWLLRIACELGPEPPGTDDLPIDFLGCDLVLATRDLFERMALATGNQWLHDTIRHTNERCLPVRRIEQGLIRDASEELGEFAQSWHQGDAGALQSALSRYFSRRQQLAPNIVALFESTMPHTAD